jgi:hypothetical protein
MYQLYVFPMVVYKIKQLGSSQYYKNDDCNTSWQPVHIFEGMDVGLIKRVVRSTGCSFREVLICTLTSAIRRFLLESRNISELPESIGGGVAVPERYSSKSLEILANRA